MFWTVPLATALLSLPASPEDGPTKAPEPSQLPFQSVNRPFYPAKPSREPLTAKWFGKMHSHGGDIQLEGPGNVLLGTFTNNVDPILGATLEPVGETLHSQLQALPKGEGLLLSSLQQDGPAAQVGLLEQDILVRIDDQPLRNSADLELLLTRADGEAKLDVIRAGKPTTLKVKSVRRIAIGPVTSKKSDLYIGLPVTPVDDTLRSHLNIPADSGLVVSSVAENSPAAKAGIQRQDILIKFGGEPVGSAEALVENIQATRGVATEAVLLRGGKEIKVTVTPAVRETEVAAAGRQLSMVYYRAVAPHLSGQNPAWSIGDIPHPPDADGDRYDKLAAEVKALRLAVEALREATKAGK